MSDSALVWFLRPLDFHNYYNYTCTSFLIFHYKYLLLICVFGPSSARSSNIIFIALTTHFLQTIASLQDKLEPLTVRLSASSKFDWISRRIQRSWGSWTNALRSLHSAKPFNVTEKRVREKKN